MAIDRDMVEGSAPSSEQARLISFHVKGLFGGDDIDLSFPTAREGEAGAKILILSGQNGTGKTTILRMIDGMLKLDFDMFRQMPFDYCELKLSTGQTLSVRDMKGNASGLEVEFAGSAVILAKSRARNRYAPEHDRAIATFRYNTLPAVRAIEFNFLPVDRSRAQKDWKEQSEPTRPMTRPKSLAERVKEFLTVSQVDYRRYFRDEELGVIPRLLDRMQGSQNTPIRLDLLDRVLALKKHQPLMRRYGLHFDSDLLDTIEVMIGGAEHDTANQLVLLETYIEMQEGAQKAKNLITKRLQEFDTIMKDFLYGKSISIDAGKGLHIVSSSGDDLDEADLSSGEYHFLYMMVDALLCKRLGSVIAIDEPELSLHVSWQRKLVSALARCAAGASPLFIFATHSVAISAQHADRMVELSAVD